MQPQANEPQTQPAPPPHSRRGATSPRRRRTVILAALAVLVAGSLAIFTTRTPEKSTPLTPEAKAFTLSRCGKIGDGRMQLACYTNHFEQVRLREGVVPALDQLVDWHLDPEGAAFAPHCHEVLHQLGVNEMRSAESEESRIGVFAQSRVTCTGGFVHGALTEYYANFSPAEVESTRATLCASLIDSVSTSIGHDADATGWLSWNCNHMLGHVLYEDNSVDLVRGASLCEIFDMDTRQDARRGCEAGFFMEHFLVMGRTPAAEGYAASPQSLKDIHTLCRDVSQDVAWGCWNESGGVVYIMADRDWAAAGDACRTATNVIEYRQACYESLGRNIAPYAGYEPEQMAQWCREIGDTEAVDSCARVIAGSQAMELANVPAGEKLCRDLITDQSRLDACLRSVRETGSQIAGSGFDGGIGTWDR